MSPKGMLCKRASSRTTIFWAVFLKRSALTSTQFLVIWVLKSQYYALIFQCIIDMRKLFIRLIYSSTLIGSDFYYWIRSLWKWLFFCGIQSSRHVFIVPTFMKIIRFISKLQFWLSIKGRSEVWVWKGPPKIWEGSLIISFTRQDILREWPTVTLLKSGNRFAYQNYFSFSSRLLLTK